MAVDLPTVLLIDSCPAIDVATSPPAFVAKHSGTANVANVVSETARQEKADVAVGDSEPNEKPTHFYVADGHPMGMIIHPSRVAVKFNTSTPDSETLAELGLTLVRPVNQEFAVYEPTSVGGGDSFRKSIVGSSVVLSVAPVFIVQSSNSEAVLLDEIIVALKPDVKASEYFNGNDNFTAYRPLPGTPDQFIATVAKGVGEAALTVANTVISDTDVAWASPNFYQSWQKYFIPNDARFANQWHFNNVGQGGGLVDADVDLPEAWDINQGGSSSITIGVIDDGVSLDHPDIDAWVNPGEFAGDGLDNDGNGWVDDIRGWNFVANNANSHHTDAADRHGTAVAGVAAGRGNNSIGVAGASYNSKVLSAKIFEGAAVASDANIAAALYYTAGRNFAGTGTWNAASVVNNSWGGGGANTVINAALTWGTTLGRQGAGATYFFATGNEFGAVIEPALQSLNIPGVIAVGATNNLGTLSNYSNFGPAVDFATPSNDSRVGYLTIDTTDRVGTAGYDPSDYTGIGANGFGGTSSSTPLAAGISALVLAQAAVQGIPLSPVQLRSFLRNNTDIAGNGIYQYSTTNGKNNGFGYGRLNAASALGGLGKAEISVTAVTSELFDAVSTTSLGTVTIGESQELTLRVRNQGTSALNLTGLTIAAGPFTVVRGFDDTSLALGEATSFTIRYVPTVAGVDTRTITILANDLDEAEFTFNVSATAIAPSVGGSVFEDWDGDGIKDAPDTAIAGRTLYLDSNANGVFDESMSTTTFSNITPLAILDNVAVTSTLAVSGVTNFVTDVNVRLSITHTFDSDLVITLISPSGARIVLVSNAGGGGDNFTNTVLDDEAATSVQSGVAPFAGSYRPFQPLSALDGLTGANVNGTWSLEVSDVATDDIGTLNSWDVVISTGEQSTQTKTNGFYAFFGLANGIYTVRNVVPSGWTTSGPVGGSHAFTIAAPTDFFVGRDFGNGQNNKFYGQVFEDVDSDGVFDATEVGLGGRSLYLDGNSNGVFDAPTTTTLSNTTVLPILDVATVSSTIASVLAGVISDVNVRVNITHTFASDLDVFLIHPDGTQIELFTDVGGGGTDFVNTVLDQQATTGVIGTTGFNTAPFTGTYRPEGNLSLLNGKLASGVWTLRITDDAATDIGTLNNWDLIIGAGVDIPATTAANGTASFILPNGVNQVRLAPFTGYANTIPADGLRTVTAADTPLFDQRFGSKSAPKVQSVVFGDGANHRSMVNGITVDFDSVVSIAPGAFVLERKNGASWDNLDAELTIGIASSLFNNNTRATLTFSGSGIIGGSLADGNYRLTMVAANITWNGLQLDGDSNGSGGDNFVRGTADTDKFFRYFGDFDGNRIVNGLDLARFRMANGTLAVDPTYNSIFDYNGNGVINGIDLAQFRFRNGTLLGF